MKKFLIFLGVVIVIIALAGGYFGLVPGVSAIFGSNKSRDLGVSYTQDDFQQAVTKGGVSVVANQNGVSTSDSLVVTGSHAVQQSFTNAEITAALNEYETNWQDYPVQDLQVRINDDGTAEVSGYILKDRLEGYARATGIPESDIAAVRPYLRTLPAKIPVYGQATTSATNGVVDVDLLKAEVLRFGVPQAQLDALQDQVNDFVTDQLAAYGVRINTGRLESGKIFFDGSLADSVSTFVGH